MLERMWGIKTSVIFGVIPALGAVTTRLGEELQQIPPLPRTVKPPGLWQRTTLEGAKSRLYFFLHCSLSSPDGFKYLSHFRNCHISLYAAVRVFPFIFDFFCVMFTSVCASLLFSIQACHCACDILLPLHHLVHLYWLGSHFFLPPSVLREAQTIIFLMTFLPGNNRNVNRDLAALTLTCSNDYMKKIGFFIIVSYAYI